MSNAVKFTNKGSVSLQVETLSYFDSDSDSTPEVRLKFSITDTGIGMTEANLRKVFFAI